MSKSIISNVKECYVCKNPENLHRHHTIYGRGRRAQSEKYGCWVWLCPYHHDMSDLGVHNKNKALDRELKELSQRKWEERFGTREQFIEVFGKSYL